MHFKEITVNKLALASAFALSLAFALPSFAQQASREDVKAERDRAVKAGETKVDGEGRTGAMVKPAPGAPRADIKAERDAAGKAGANKVDGEGRTNKQMMAAKSKKTRAEAKAERDAALKDERKKLPEIGKQ